MAACLLVQSREKRLFIRGAVSRSTGEWVPWRQKEVRTGISRKMCKLVRRVWGRVPYKAPAETIYQLIGGLRGGMGYCGTRNSGMGKTRFIRVTNAALRRIIPDVHITRRAQLQCR